MDPRAANEAAAAAVDDSAATAIEAKPSPRFVGRVITATMIVFGSAIFLMLLWSGRHVLLLLFAGLLLSVLLRVPALLLGRWTGLSDHWTVPIVVTVLTALFALAIWLGGPMMMDQLQSFQKELMRSFEALRGQLQDNRFGRILLDSLPARDSLDYQALWDRAAGVWATVLGALGSMLLVFVVGVFFAFNPGLYIRGLLRIVPLHRRRRACDVAGMVTHDLRQWLIGQFIGGLIMWAGTWISLWLIGVPMSFMLGLLAGLLNFVPYIGPLLAFLPIAAVGFTDSVHTGVLATLAYFVVQAIEGNIVMPLLYQRLIHIPPALTLGSQLLFGTLAGALGIALATPLLAVVLVLIRSLYVEDALGDSMERPPIPHEDESECLAPTADTS